MSAVLDLPRTRTTSLQAVKKAVDFALEEQVSVVLSNVDWGTYQNTVQEFDGKQNPHFYYDKGNLLITSNSSEYEEIKDTIVYLIYIFAAFGVPEIWRFDGEKMQILKLENDKYIEISNSLALPKVTPEILTDFVEKSEKLSRLEWISEVRNWAKSV